MTALQLWCIWLWVTITGLLQGFFVSMYTCILPCCGLSYSLFYNLW